MSVAEELEKLKKLRDEGTITDEQYERARAKLLEEHAEEAGGKPVAAELAEGENRPRRRRRDSEDEEDYFDRPRREKQAREWCMVLHLSLFAGHTVPLGGIIAPIVIWQTQKEKMPEIDEHGKNAVNWVISNILYVLICIPLCFVFVGFALLILLAALNVIFPVIAAMKANEGRAWKYPLAIPFFS
jgi:uncharacterized Tic20 family protein